MRYGQFKIAETESYTDRANAVTGTKESGLSNLEPWHHTSKHNPDDYWIADDTKDFNSTFDNGYYYPETPLEFQKDPVEMRKQAIVQLNYLYGGDEMLAKMRLPPSERGDPVTEIEWRAFVHIKTSSVSGTWGIHLFFGEPPADPNDWFKAENRVGTVNVLSNSNIAACPNCQKQRKEGQIITGLVLLTKELEIKNRNIPHKSRNAVVEYLKKNLTWRIAKNAQNVPITDDMGLVVGVSAREVVYPLEPTELPDWKDPEYFSEITKNKQPGGFKGLPGW